MPDPLAGMPPRFLHTPEAARFLGLSGRTLEKHPTYGTGPTYRKIGGRVIYALDDLKAWADLGAKQSTSDPGKGTVLPAKRVIAASPALHLERLRKRSHWALFCAAGAAIDRHHACGGISAGAARDPPCRQRLSPPRRAAHQARSRAARTDRLLHWPHHHGSMEPTWAPPASAIAADARSRPGRDAA